MAIARVGLATVQNPTSNANITPVWSVVPPDGARMIALMSAIVTATMNVVPSGWTLAGTVDAGANMRSWIYTKTAAGEGVDPTWTMSSSTKNGGTILAYSGADPIDPGDIVSAVQTTAGTSIVGPSLALLAGGYRVDFASGRHGTVGSPQQWSSDDPGPGLTYPNRFGSNSGTDLTYAVAESGPKSAGTRATTWTSTTSEGTALAWSIGLRPTAAPPAGLTGQRWGIDI